MPGNEVAGGIFSASSPGHGWARKNISSLIQWASTAAASLGSGWKFGANLSIFVFMVVFVSCVILSNPLQMHNWLLIYYSKVAQGCGVIIVRVICSGAPPHIASVCGSLCQRLPGTGMDGNIKQQGKKQHIRAAAVYWRHAEPSQVHRPQFHKYGSITQSSLVSGLQARLCRICLIFQTVLIRKMAL